MSLLSPSLEAFWAVVQKGTVLEAAKTVSLTQTGVTQRIRSLEKQLGVTLFTRSRKGMRLTSEGESLLRYVQAARDLEGDTLEKISGRKSSTLIDICISSTASTMRSRILPRVGAVCKKHPQLRMNFDFTDPNGIVGKLKNGQALLAALPENQVGLELDSKTMATERYILVGPAVWKRRRLSDILEKECPISLSELEIPTANLLTKYKLSKKVRRDKHQTNSLDALLAMVEQGLGYSVLTAELAEPFLKKGSLINLDKSVYLEENLALAWYPRNEMPTYLKDLITALIKK
ncbi:MAG: LysR family transcriptional regulator [Bacillota bacterium]